MHKTVANILQGASKRCSSCRAGLDASWWNKNGRWVWARYKSENTVWKCSHWWVRVRKSCRSSKWRNKWCASIKSIRLMNTIWNNFVSPAHLNGSRNRPWWTWRGRAWVVLLEEVESLQDGCTYSLITKSLKMQKVRSKFYLWRQLRGRLSWERDRISCPESIVGSTKNRRTGRRYFHIWSLSFQCIKNRHGKIRNICKHRSFISVMHTLICLTMHQEPWRHELWKRNFK